MAKVFILDADVEAAVAAREAAAADGHDAEVVPDFGAMERRLRDDDPYAVVLTGAVGSREIGRQLSRMGSSIPRPPVLIVCGADEEAEAARLDVDAVVLKPVEPAEIQVALARELERFELQITTGIVGRSDAIREVLERVATIASVHSTVLVTGESGTGKELVARGIHRLSPRRGKPFIAVNCGAIPESLLESELFGHEKGAFTGATSRRKGMFELADDGSLFLDEIGEMPAQLQTRLLRVLETRRFMRVGGDVELEVDVRVIAATNQQLRERVRRGDFRKDLYYRLNVLHVDLPPLRDRRQDIPILVRRFVSELSRTHDREFKGLSREAMQILLDYEWPGNIRELRNLIESMVVLAPGAVIEADDIPIAVRETSGRALIPVVAGNGPGSGELVGTGSAAMDLSQLEFLFRTLVEMKIDLEDLRAEFDRFRSRYTEGDDTALAFEPGSNFDLTEVVPGDIPPAIQLEADMTMADIEEAAIRIALREVDGNRRKAAERLQIGERTLYRKIKEYGIEA